MTSNEITLPGELYSFETNFGEILSKHNYFVYRKCIEICCLLDVYHFIQSWWIYALSVLNGLTGFFWENINILCFNFLSFIKTEVLQIVEIFPYGRQGLVYLTGSILWLHRRESGQQPWCWLHSFQCILSSAPAGPSQYKDPILPA